MFESSPQKYKKIFFNTNQNATKIVNETFSIVIGTICNQVTDE